MYTDDLWDYAHVFNRVRNLKDSSPCACCLVIEFSPLSFWNTEDKDTLIEEATGRKINYDYTGWVG